MVLSFPEINTIRRWKYSKKHVHGSRLITKGLFGITDITEYVKIRIFTGGGEGGTDQDSLLQML